MRVAFFYSFPHPNPTAVPKGINKYYAGKLINIGNNHFKSTRWQCCYGSRCSSDWPDSTVLQEIFSGRMRHVHCDFEVVAGAFFHWLQLNVQHTGQYHEGNCRHRDKGCTNLQQTTRDYQRERKCTHKFFAFALLKPDCCSHLKKGQTLYTIWTVSDKPPAHTCPNNE